MKQLALQGVSPFANAPIDAPDDVVTVCKTEAMAVRWCLDFAREFGVTQRTVALLCGWRSEGFLSEIASEANEKRMPPKRIRKFTLATGCRLLEQFHERQQIVREMTGGLTSHDKARMAVAAMRAQCERRSEARAA